MLDVRLTVDGEPRSFVLVGDGVDEAFRDALAQFTKYKRAEVAGRFRNEGPGWPALAESTKARHEQRSGEAKERAWSQMERKLRREVRRARRSGDPVTAHTREAVLREFLLRKAGGGEHGAVFVDMPTRADREVKRQRDAIARALRVAKKSKDAGAIFIAKERLSNFDFVHDQSMQRIAAARALKSIRGLGDRIERAEKRYEGKMLGKVASSITSKVRGATMTMTSAVPYSGVLNEGGTVGNGSKIKARTFLELTAADLDTLVDLVRDRVVDVLLDRDG